MLDLHTVNGYVKDIRVLLLDKIKPYRYSDISVLAGLNLALADGARLRPDLFIRRSRFHIPEYDAITGDEVPIERQFRKAFVYMTAAHVLLRDEEDVQDDRANGFLMTGQDVLLGVRRGPMAPSAGTPTPSKGQQ